MIALSHRLAAISRLLFLALLPAVVALLLASCSDDEDNETLGEQTLLQDVPFAPLLGEAFPGTHLTEKSSNLYTLAERWRVRELRPRLAPSGPDGELAEQALIFFVLEGPAGEPAPFLNLAAGTYALTVSSSNGGAQVSEALLLSGDASLILPLPQAQGRGLSAFQQDSRNNDTIITITPAFSTDIEADGQEELVLARNHRSGAISWVEYQVYRQQEASLWQKVDLGYADTPAQTLLNYWANISTAINISSRWEPKTRLEKVWSWLTDEDAPVTAELMASLPAGPATPADTEAALTSLREFFGNAYATFAADFQDFQPWPGFINAFRNTERVELIDIAAADYKSADDAKVTSLAVFAEREGDEVVPRRFKVTFDLKKNQDGRWLLSRVSGEEVRNRPVDTE